MAFSSLPTIFLVRKYHSYVVHEWLVAGMIALPTLLLFQTR